ncbi:Actin-depolymerizing factor 1 [Zea mays]|uniref:Actin-depolymerizing factor 1 n=1 Tax=Zea mays TaxID=4577 RepID=A0A1D6IBK6_MAIZE|nr:Actin-depolymerizing factor 1 [Zea mays]
MANSSSGLAVNDECKVKFRELKSRRSFRFIVFRIDDTDMEIKVDRLGGPNQGYGDFTDSLPANECRYAIYDLDFTTIENCQKSKIFFFSCPLTLHAPGARCCTPAPRTGSGGSWTASSARSRPPTPAR